MKKFLSVFVGVIVVFLLCACGNSNNSPKYTVEDLTAEDYVYIDTVYDYIDMWDRGLESGSKTYFVDKISFFEFATLDRITFYLSYQFSQTTYNSSVSSTKNVSVGFFISDGSLKKITEDTFDNDNYYTVEEQDNQTRHQGYKMTTASSGTDWRHDASKEEKYQIIVEAYLKCLNS